MSEILQGTDTWRALRCGKVTASKVADIIRKTKTGVSATRKNYAAQIITERLTGIPTVTYSSPSMDWGKEKEPEARSAYEFYQGDRVEQIAFAPHPRIEMAGCSPDGLVGADGLVEFKCPDSATHLDYLLNQSIPADYETQMLFQMSCTDRSWCDFVTYDPRLPEHMRLFIKRLHRDDERIAELEKEVERFLAEIDAKLSELNKIYGQATA